MSFAWKMILAVSLLLALSLSLGGAAVVDRAFRTELDAACRNAEEDMQLFGMTLEALCLNRPVSDTAGKWSASWWRTVRRSAITNTRS